jgi:hypothetical protein
VARGILALFSSPLIRIVMPRIESSWSKWRISWRHVPWLIVSVGGMWFSWLLVNSAHTGFGIVVLLFSAPLLWVSFKTLWRNRQPFVFTVRSDRKVKFRGGGRDETVVEENGRKVKIYTELLSGKISRAIHANSIEKYEPPHDGELLTNR